MGNLRAAALACGVVASCLGGGAAVVFATSNSVSSFDIGENKNIIAETTEAPVTTASEIAYNVLTTKTTTAKKVTTTSSSVTEKTTSATSSITAEMMNAEENSTANPIVTTTAVTTEIVTTEVTTVVRNAPTLAAAPPVVTEPVTEAPAEEYSYEDEYIEPVYEEEQETYVEPVTEPEPVAEAPTEASQSVVDSVEDSYAVDSFNTLPISNEDFIILCNAVGHEAGCNWISEYDKAKVVEVIMNRVNSPLYPNTIYGVLTQANQFSGSTAYVNLGTYASYVSESVKNAVRLYFEEPESFTEGYIGFYGDGVRNYFY